MKKQKSTTALAPAEEPTLPTAVELRRLSRFLDVGKLIVQMESLFQVGVDAVDALDGKAKLNLGEMLRIANVKGKFETRKNGFFQEFIEFDLITEKSKCKVTVFNIEEAESEINVLVRHIDSGKGGMGIAEDGELVKFSPMPEEGKE